MKVNSNKINKRKWEFTYPLFILEAVANCGKSAPFLVLFALEFCRRNSVAEVDGLFVLKHNF